MKSWNKVLAAVLACALNLILMDVSHAAVRNVYTGATVPPAPAYTTISAAITAAVSAADDIVIYNTYTGSVQTATITKRLNYTSADTTPALRSTIRVATGGDRFSLAAGAQNSTFSDLIFTGTNNTLNGGVIYNNSGGAITITDSLFNAITNTYTTASTASIYGGVIDNRGAGTQIARTIFSGNTQQRTTATYDTIWGGVIGDDGLENIQIGQLGIGKAFTEFQYWVKKLQQRGIIVAVCSKNTESIAKEPFEKHPNMVLRLSDIAVFMANWDNKADNIRKIQQILNIGFDSMVFLDDNPFERNMVRENISQICVPELPEDPALYLDYLYGLNLFETVSFTDEDVKRTEQYQKEAGRVVFQESFTNEDDFLKSLNMISDTKPFDSFSIPRIAQLSQRSNQFNLRTIRYAEEDIKCIAESDNYLTLSFSLEDKFGDNGLICAIILEKHADKTLFIDTWIMSCRVLKRGIEAYTLNSIIRLAKANGFTKITGEYIPTSKNEMVRDHYKDLGFENTSIENFWQLNVSEYEIKNNFITKK